MASEPKWRIRDWFKDIDERTLERLRIYHLELLRANQSSGFISRATVEAADRIHFADSLIGARIILKLISNEKEVWDLGSGSGFPGVVMSILRPDLGMICLDSDERKVGFIKQLSQRLELENLAARCDRVETLTPDSISCAIARGLAPLKKCLKLLNKAVRVDGTIYQFKGKEWNEEIASAMVALGSTWNSELIEHYDLPKENSVDPKEALETHTIIKSTRIK